MFAPTFLLTVAAGAVVAEAAATPVKRQSSVPYGTAILSCTEADVVALTFDDGPYMYTDQVLDLLEAADFKATFFVNGDNYDSIYTYATTVQRAAAAGHQIGSHTWSHADLTTLDTAGVTSEMTQLEDALTTILGYFPTYMRPPYFSYTDTTLDILGTQLGYHVIICDIDTEDWMYDTVGDDTSVGVYTSGLADGGTISLEHDVYENTADNLLPQFIAAIQAAGKTSVTVGECLGDDAANWYRTSRTGTGTSTATATGPTSTATGIVSPDATCGGTVGYICPSGECCSQYGYCDTGDAYCGAGCQASFGICS